MFFCRFGSNPSSSRRAAPSDDQEVEAVQRPLDERISKYERIRSDVTADVESRSAESLTCDWLGSTAAKSKTSSLCHGMLEAIDF